MADKLDSILKMIRGTDASKLPLGTRPNDTSRPVLLHPGEDGMGTEESITRPIDGRWVTLPTIVNGQKLSDKAAIEAFRSGENKPIGVYNNRVEAELESWAHHNREEELRYPDEERMRKAGNLPSDEERKAKLTPEPFLHSASAGVMEMPGLDLNAPDPDHIVGEQKPRYLPKPNDAIYHGNASLNDGVARGDEVGQFQYPDTHLPGSKEDSDPELEKESKLKALKDFGKRQKYAGNEVT